MRQQKKGGIIMKLNFSLEMTPEEMTTLANAEVESQRIREGLRRDRDFDDAKREWEDEFEEYRKAVHKEFEEWRKECES